MESKTNDIAYLFAPCYPFISLFLKWEFSNQRRICIGCFSTGKLMYMKASWRQCLESNPNKEGITLKAAKERKINAQQNTNPKTSNLVTNILIW